MKRIFVLIFLCGSYSTFLLAEPTAPQQGVLVRMRLVACPGPQHSFMMALSGSARVGPEDPCPQYTLLTEKLAYIIVGRASNQLIPLAEATTFRVQNREILIRNSGSGHEAHFMIKEMMLRSDWERAQRVLEQMAASHEQDASIVGQDTP